MLVYFVIGAPGILKYKLVNDFSMLCKNGEVKTEEETKRERKRRRDGRRKKARKRNEMESIWEEMEMEIIWDDFMECVDYSGDTIMIDIAIESLFTKLCMYFSLLLSFSFLSFLAFFNFRLLNLWGIRWFSP